MDHIIVGIDPGKTSAVACLSLEGKLIYVSHKRDAGMQWFVDEISNVGIPSIMAADKSEPGSVARKLNSMFNSRLSLPQKDITVAEKRKLSKETGIKNAHERDAYSAAIKAYNAAANKLNQAEHRLKQMNVENRDRIKAKILGRYSLSEAVLGRPANRK